MNKIREYKILYESCGDDDKDAHLYTRHLIVSSDDITNLKDLEFDLNKSLRKAVKYGVKYNNHLLEIKGE